MVEYKCDRCGYITLRKSNFVSHLNRKNSCFPSLEELDIDSIKMKYGLIDHKMVINGNEDNSIEKKYDDERKHKIEDPIWAKEDPIWAKEDPVWAKEDPIWAKEDPVWAKEDPIWAKNKGLFCKTCGTNFNCNRGLQKHKKICKNIYFNSIYNIQINILENKEYDIYIYIINPLYIKNNYKVGITNNIHNILRNLRKKNSLEPLLYYLYPCKNRVNTEKKLLEIVCPKGIYNGNLYNLIEKISNIQKQVNNSELLQIEPIVNKTYYCENCKEIFTGKKEIFDHVINCRFFQEKIRNNKNESGIIKKSEESDKIINITNNTITNNTITNNTITNNMITNQTINININKYNNENLDYLNSDFLTELCKIPYSSIKNLLKHIHFNKKHPENMNVKITNRKESYAQIYNGTKWEIKNKKDIISDLVDNSYNIIDDHYEKEGKNKLGSGFKTRYISYKDKYEENEKKLIYNIKKDTELLLVNNS